MNRESADSNGSDSDDEFHRYKALGRETHEMLGELFMKSPLANFT